MVFVLSGTKLVKENEAEANPYSKTEALAKDLGFSRIHNEQ